jgi:hypothetical protein
MDPADCSMGSDSSKINRNKLDKSGRLANGRIDKSVLTISEPRRHRDKEHLKFVSSHACLICGRQPSDPHYLRFTQPRALGRKVSDEFTVPLCRMHHREVHRATNEPKWWAKYNLTPLPFAEALWAHSHPVGSASGDPSETEEQTIGRAPHPIGVGVLSPLEKTENLKTNPVSRRDAP